MTREAILQSCMQTLQRTRCLLLESATGTGKSRISILLINHLCSEYYKGKKTKLLLLVAKKVHKITWQEEFEKWGGVKVDEVTIECYESLHKHTGEEFTFILSDEVHHIGSELRLEALNYIKFDYFIGLSATIPMQTKQHFRYTYRAQIVSCNIIEAIEDDLLPEPTILLFPLEIESTKMSEVLEVNPKAKGPIYQGTFYDLWKCKKQKIHALLRCTQKQKLQELEKTISWFKNKAMTGNPAMKQTWLYFCGKRLEYLADCKLQWVKLILQHLENERTITFCKTIAQTEQLGKNCIHSKNKEATQVYNDFNAGKINHITAVNILNENANLVNCQYGVFCNITSSEIITQQRQGRLLRHKNPVRIIPYYKGTREEQLVEKGIEGFKTIKTIHSIQEI